jgi:hypothetical protein
VWYTVPAKNRKSLDKKAQSAILLSYLSDANSYQVWDLEKRTVVKSCNVLFDEQTFPYGSPLAKSTPSPTHVELPWPFQTSPILPIPSSPLGESPPSPRSVHTEDLPLLDIPVEPRFDRRLQASIHSPRLVSPKESSPSPPSPPTSPKETTTPVPPPASHANSDPAPRRSG